MQTQVMTGTALTSLKKDAAACMYLAEQSSLSHVGGDLYEELKKTGGRFAEARTAADVLRPCISALMYLHSQVCLTHTLYSNVLIQWRLHSTSWLSNAWVSLLGLVACWLPSHPLDVKSPHSAVSTMQLAVECLLVCHCKLEAASNLVGSMTGLLCTPVVEWISTAW